jgi:hypothetical protein
MTTRLRRICLAVTAAGLLAVFGGAVRGVATVEATLEPGTPAAAAAQRLQHRVEQRESRFTADCPWLRDGAAAGRAAS